MQSNTLYIRQELMKISTDYSTDTISPLSRIAWRAAACAVPHASRMHRTERNRALPAACCQSASSMFLHAACAVWANPHRQQASNAELIGSQAGAAALRNSACYPLALA